MNDRSTVRRLDHLALAALAVVAGAAAMVWGWLRFANGESDETILGAVAIVLGFIVLGGGLRALRRLS